MARQRDGSKIIILWTFSNPILQRSCHYRLQHGDFDMILGPVCQRQRQRQRFLSFMHSSISNDKSKARGVCSTSPFTSFKYDIETVRETVARGPRSQPYTQVYIASEKVEAMTNRKTQFPAATDGHDRRSLATTLVRPAFITYIIILIIVKIIKGWL